MRKLALLVAAGALALPSLALAGKDHGSGSGARHSPAQSCRQQRSGMGAAAFRELYGTNKHKTNAFGRCVAKQAHVQAQAHETATGNAAKACRAERAADPVAFAAKYGTNHNGRNAFGKCVSAMAKQDASNAIASHDAATVNAAKACKAERAADPAAFAHKYGTNRNGRNAFGKCVSQKARADHGGDGTGTGTGTGTGAGTGTGTGTGTDTGTGTSTGTGTGTDTDPGNGHGKP
jgi:hypothetical protein